jgi:hypothetical protein
MRGLLILLCALALPALATDPRYIEGPVQRAADGTIKRSAARLAEFRRDHACPATGKTTGACPGWAIDHVVPLVCGGQDAEWNMQWLPLDIKSCAGTKCKDRWEQRVYCRG